MDGLTRRGFLKASCGVGATALLSGVNMLTMEEVAQAAIRNPLPAGQSILVVVTLYGGNDGLNTVVPFSDSAYYAARTDLAYAEADVIKLDADLGLNPSMTGFKSLWDAGRLAIVRGVGYPDSDHSHFKSMDIWQTASPISPVGSGWLGRWLDHVKADPITAINIGTTMPPLLVGNTVTGSTLPVTGLRLPKGNLRTQLRKVGASAATLPPLQRAASQALVDWFSTSNTTTDALSSALPVVNDPTTDPASATGTGGEGKLADQLGVVARLINAGVPTRVYSVSLGGFDTHSNEKGAQSALLAQVSQSISNFMKQIGATSRADDVTVFVYSEFGRRVAANLSNGTDHGTAGPAFIVGNKVKGGFYGEQPSLTKLWNGDLEVRTDFRDIYASLLETVLQTDAAPILGDWRGRLAFS